MRQLWRNAMQVENEREVEAKWRQNGTVEMLE